MRRAQFIAAACLALLAPGIAVAQPDAYPSRPVKLLVGYPPGGAPPPAGPRSRRGPPAGGASRKPAPGGGAGGRGAGCPGRPPMAIPWAWR